MMLDFSILTAKERGNILGRLKVDKPAGHSWESFAKLLLATMPPSDSGTRSARGMSGEIHTGRWSDDMGSSSPLFRRAWP